MIEITMSEQQIQITDLLGQFWLRAIEEQKEQEAVKIMKITRTMLKAWRS